MDLRPISENQKKQYNKLVTHVIQSWEWGEARKSTGIKVLRYGLYDRNTLKVAFQITFHKIPFTNYSVGYLPKGSAPDENLAKALIQIGRKLNCAFIKAEPNVPSSVIPSASEESMDSFQNKSGDSSATPQNDSIIDPLFHPSPKPLFSKHNFVLDLTKSEDELLKNMHPKTRYNIKVAEKHGVKVEERNDDDAFKIYLKLYFETTLRQNYHGHNEIYHTQVWQTLKSASMARILLASYKKEPLAAWMLLNFKDTFYYPYGGSSTVHKEVMVNNLIAWETIKLGKKMGLKKFDMWGALGSNADPKDPWYGFHKFKQGYGGELVEYIGTYDLVLVWPIYHLFTTIDKLMPLKVFLLKLLGK